MEKSICGHSPHSPEAKHTFFIPIGVAYGDGMEFIMREIDISLLWPRDKREFSCAALSPTAADDLGLGPVCEELCGNEDDRKTVRSVLTELCRDEEVIRYRQDIFDDFLSSEELIAGFEDILRQLKQLEHVSLKARSGPEEEKLWALFSRFKDLEAYVGCVTAIFDAMRDIPLKSEGMGAFREKVKLLIEDPEFVAMAGAVKSLNLELNQIQSITLGVNLDMNLNPEEVTLESVNSIRFREHSMTRSLQNLLRIQTHNNSDGIPSCVKAGLDAQTGGVDGLARPRGEFLGTKLHKAKEDRRDPIMHLMYKEIAGYLRPVVRQLSSELNRYTRVYTGYMANVIPEIVFYLSFARLQKKLTEHGMACCRPAIAQRGGRVCAIKGAYNLKLAIHMMNEGRNPAAEIVTNTVTFGEKGRVLIITGPNRGGKTVYTQAVGLAQVLFQAGVFVPGDEAEISPADNIFTHFPADESRTVELGRLGEESKRLGEIFGQATSLSLILLNESLTSTSHLEGLYLAEEVVRAMRYLGVRAIFNTHLHELAENVDALNADTPGDSLILSMTTGVVSGRRSYVVEPGAPIGKSYAMDIAVRFGVSFDQIARVIDQKR